MKQNNDGKYTPEIEKDCWGLDCENCSLRIDEYNCNGNW